MDSKDLLESLGTEYYELCSEFYEDIIKGRKEYRPKYNVFLSTRCLNLMYLFHKCAPEDNSTYFEDTTYSANAFLSNASYFAEVYRTNGIVPAIWLYDDVMRHGRAINEFIDKFIELVYGALKSAGGNFNHYKVDNDIRRSIYVRVIMRRDEGVLLSMRNWPGFKEKKVANLQDLNQFSLKISTFLAKFALPNTSFINSFEIEPCEEDPAFLSAWETMWEQSESIIGSYRYGRYLSANRTQVLFDPDVAKNKKGRCSKAYYCFNVRDNYSNGAVVIEPFIIHSAFPVGIGDYRSILSKVFGPDLVPLSPDPYSFWGEKCPASAELFECFLCQNLLLLITQNTPFNNLKSRMDWQRTAMSFKCKNDPNVEAVYKAIVEATEPWMQWEWMDELVLYLTKDSEPVLDYKKENIDRTKELYRPGSVARDVAYGYGYASEMNAHKQYHREIYPSGKNLPAVTANTFFDDIFGDSLRNNIMGAVLEANNMLIRDELETSCVSYDVSGGVSCCTMFSPGKTSLYILPAKHFKYLSILSFIERNACGDVDRICMLVRRWYRDKLDKEDIVELTDFIEQERALDQNMQDWDLDYTRFLDWAADDIDAEIMDSKVFLNLEDAKKYDWNVTRNWMRLTDQEVYEYQDSLRERGLSTDEFH